jgi:hypothetical protein
MANWKKVIVSGSSAELADLTLDTALTVPNGGTGITTSGVGNFLVGSAATSLTLIGSNGSGTVVRTSGATGLNAAGTFSGTFSGDGSGLTGVVGTVTNALVDGNGIVNFSYDGSSTQTVTVDSDATTGGNIKPVNITANGVGFDISTIDGAALITSAGELAVNVDGASIEVSADALRVKALGITNGMLAGSITNAKLVNDSVTLGSTEAILGTTVTTLNSLTLTNTKATGSFTGSFTGDGSGLTGLATTLTVQGDTGGTSTVDLASQVFDVAGSTNIKTLTSGQTVTVALEDDIAVNNVVVYKDLTVYGTASFANSENLLVADRFVLFASGSTTVGDGGIVVQQATQDIGELFGFEAAASRWGLDTVFNAASSTFSSEAYISAVVDIDGGQTDLSRYQKNGNIKVQAGEIYIYS